jgi:hypothetical protein
MNGFTENRWPTIAFFLSCGCFFFGCVWYLWIGHFQPDRVHASHSMKATAMPLSEADPNTPILLIKDRETVVGDTRVIYRGRYDGTLRVDLYILSLDPHFAYAHHIDETSARCGFQMGEHRFRLLAAGWGSIRLVRM